MSQCSIFSQGKASRYPRIRCIRRRFLPALRCASCSGSASASSSSTTTSSTCCCCCWRLPRFFWPATHHRRGVQQGHVSACGMASQLSPKLLTTLPAPVPRYLQPPTHLHRCSCRPPQPCLPAPAVPPAPAVVPPPPPAAPGTLPPLCQHPPAVGGWQKPARDGLLRVIGSGSIWAETGRPVLRILFVVF